VIYFNVIISTFSRGDKEIFEFLEVPYRRMRSHKTYQVRRRNVFLLLHWLRLQRWRKIFKVYWGTNSVYQRNTIMAGI